MADKSIEGLATAGTLAGTDLFPLKQAAAELVSAPLSAMKQYLQQGSRPIVSVTGTSKTFALTDMGTFQNCSNGSTQTLTVPPQASVPWEDNCEIEGVQYGAGQVVFAAGAGVTINPSTTLKVSAQYKVWVLKRIGLNEWLLAGSLVA